MKTTIKIQDLMTILKPVQTCGFMDLCANYKRDIESARDSGESHYEISGLNTKSGQPFVIEFYENQIR